MRVALFAVILAVYTVPAEAASPRHGSAQFFHAPDYRDFDEWEDAWLNARMRFVDAKNGWIITDGPVFRSTDGGAMWTPLEGWNPISPDTIWFLDAKRGWLHDATGGLLMTEDGGSTWKGITPSEDWTKPGFQYPPDIFRFKDAQNGVGWDVPDILRTRDGGRTWKKITSLPKNEEITDFCFGASGEAYAAGLKRVGGGVRVDGMFVRRISTGSAPVVLSNPLKEEMDIGFSAECFFKAGKLWAAAPEGSAYWSKDSGASWTNLHLIQNGLLRVQDNGDQWVIGESLYFLGPGRIEGDRLGAVKDDGAAALSFTIQDGKLKALFLDGNSLLRYDME